MATVLHLACSPRGDDSTSLALAKVFFDAYGRAHPNDVIEEVDLFETDLPEFTAPAAEAKYAVMGGKGPSGRAEQLWSQVVEWTDQLHRADKLAISCPMWNFSIPYKLKHWIDVVVQPGLTFSFDPDSGYNGLVTGKPAALLLSRGGDYGAGSGQEGFDRQEPYLRSILQFIGFENIQTAIAQPMLLGGPEGAEGAMAEAADVARRIAEGF
jgi:FMN-dependent NADH-azoreductase